MLQQDAVATVTHSELSKVDFIKVFEEIANHKEKQNNPAVFLNPDEKYLSKNNSLTYKELNNYANQLAHYFIKHVQKGATIALFMEQSAAAIIAVLAALKAGYPFMPLNPDLNEISVARLESFIENTNTQLIISHSCHKDHSFLLTNIANTIPRLFFDKDIAHFSYNSKQNTEEIIDLDNPAYIINSSGSSGVPKKIRIKRRGLYSCMRGIDNVFHFNQDDQIVLFAKLVFDASILDIMMPLANGAQAHIPPTFIRKDPVELKNFLQNHDISIAVLPPAMLMQLNPADFRKLRAVISTGEKIDIETLKKWSHILIVDGYGPAEATIATWLRKILFKYNDNAEEQLAYEMNDIPGLEYFILTPPNADGVVSLDNLKEMPPGEVGEIYIAGVGLGEYLDEKLSAERFPTINHPTIKDKKIKVFQTHDLAIRDVNGNVEIIGRTDRQRKIDGELFCPEEIEAVLRATDDNIAIAYVDIDETNRNIIRGYIELKDKTKKIYLPGLYEKIVKTLSLKMAPEQWVILDKIPLNQSFKLSKEDLSKLRQIPGEYIQSFNRAAPIDDLEKQIAKHLFDILNVNIPNFTIYRDDNILYLGLKSLQCAMFLRVLRNEFRHFNFRMTLPELMEAPTIASIARVIRRLQKTPGYSADNIIVPFNTVANPHKVTPVILCPSLMGDPVEDYGKLKEMWPHQRQLYLLMNRGKDCLNDIDNYPMSIARDDAKTIVSQFPDPDKPLFIAGWSLGGLRGLLLMHALDKVYGRKNVRLLMFDTEAAIVRQLKSPEEFATHLLKFCEENLQRILQITLADVGIVKSELAKLPNEYQVYYFFDKLAQTIKGPQSDVKKYSLEIIKNNFLYLLRFVVPNKISNITLIAAKKTQSELENLRLDPASSKKSQTNQEHLRLWHPSLLQINEIISVEGNHKSILLSDSVKHTAELMNQFCIKQEISIASEKIREKLRNPIDIDVDELINYVPARGALDICDKDDFDLADRFTDIISKNTAKSVLLLGEAAVGKSTFIQFLTLDLIKKYADLSILYIKLSRYQDPAEDLIDKHLKRLGLTKEEVQYVKAHIPLVIFIDDYEEIDKQQFKNLIATNKLSELNAMVVFCVRNTYLLLKYSGTNYRSLFYPITKGKIDKESFKEMYVKPFKIEQTLSYIKKYLENCPEFDELPKEWQTPDPYLHYLKIIPNATDLCSSPYFLNRYLKHIRKIVKMYEGKKLHEFEELTEKALLDLVTQDFYEREFDKMAAAGMSLTLDYPTEMEAFSIALAYDMYRKKIYKVTYKEAVRFIAPEHKEWQEYFGLSDTNLIRIREGCLVRQVPAENPNDGYDFEFDNPRLRDYYAAKKFGDYRLLQVPRDFSPEKLAEPKPIPSPSLAVTTLFVTQPPAPNINSGISSNLIKEESKIPPVNPIFGNKRDSDTPDCSGKKLTLPDGRIITVNNIYKAAADGNCSFRVILEHDYLGQNSSLNRKYVIDIFLKHLGNTKVVSLIANDIRAKYEEWLCNAWVMDADKDFPEEMKEAFREFKRKFEKITSKDYQEGVSRQLNSYCENINNVKLYLEKYLIKDEIFPHLHGCVSAFAQIFATKIYCIQVQANGELILVKDSTQETSAIYKKEIFLLQNKDRNHFDYLEVSISPAETPQNISAAEYSSHGLLKPSAAVTSASSIVQHENKPAEDKSGGIKLN